jgi:hypothetical protein
VKVQHFTLAEWFQVLTNTGQNLKKRRNKEEKSRKCASQCNAIPMQL